MKLTMPKLVERLIRIPTGLGEEMSIAVPETMATTVKELHKEVSEISTVERLKLQSLIPTIDTVDEQYATRLQQLGFTSNAKVKGVRTKKYQAKVVESRINMINEYETAYPGYKFIPSDAVQHICTKYSLVVGDAFDFIGEIPIANVEAMEKFDIENFRKKVRPEHCLVKTCHRSIHGDSRISKCRLMDMKPIMTKEEKSYFLETGHISRTNTYSDIDYEIQRNFKVIAPIKDFNMKGKTIEKGFEIEKVPIPDPIVLYPLYDGCLIVTAWGPEALDEEVFNEKQN